MRLLLLALCLISAALAQVSVRDFGAKGDGIADDTHALQSALDSIGSERAGVVLLPPGLYRITAPIIVRRNQSLQGFGAPSVIIADFSHWRGDGLTAIRVENLPPATEEEVLSNTNRIFSGFVVRSASGIQTSTVGIQIKAKTPGLSPTTVNHALLRSVLRDVAIRGFDTGLAIGEMWDSSIEDLQVQQCRRGVVIAGQSANVFFHQITLTNFPQKRGDEKNETVGILIDSGWYPEGEGRPEGISLSSSLIYGADTLVQVQRGLYVDIHNNIFDGARRNAIVLVGPEQLTIADNYIGGDDSANGIRIDAVNSSIAGPIVRHNTIVGGERSASLGILLRRGGKLRYGVEISRNTFQRVSQAIVLEETPTMSLIDGNLGSSAERKVFIDAGAGGAGTAIVNNRRTNKGDVIRLQKNLSRDLRVENNHTAK